MLLLLMMFVVGCWVHWPVRMAVEDENREEGRVGALVPFLVCRSPPPPLVVIGLAEECGRIRIYLTILWPFAYLPRPSCGLAILDRKRVKNDGTPVASAPPPRSYAFFLSFFFCWQAQEIFESSAEVAQYTPGWTKAVAVGQVKSSLNTASCARINIRLPCSDAANPFYPNGVVVCFKAKQGSSAGCRASIFDICAHGSTSRILSWRARG